MARGAQLSIIEARRSNRFRVDRHLTGEHRRQGEIALHVTNISTDGFMTAGPTSLSRGERVVIRLPQVGRIEAHMIWTMDERAGFQFERIIRSDDFALMTAALAQDRVMRHERPAYNTTSNQTHRHPDESQDPFSATSIGKPRPPGFATRANKSEFAVPWG